MILKQRSSRYDPLLLHVVFPFFHSMGWAWALRLTRAAVRHLEATEAQPAPQRRIKQLDQKAAAA